MSSLLEAVSRKCAESCAVKTRFFEENGARIVACAEAMAQEFARGARLFVVGNGGSACDAQHVAVEFMHPIFEKRRPLPAQALVCDTALITAVGNDEDFALAYASQLTILARPGDVALGISTSGQSASVNRALRAARTRDLLTVGLTGRDGGQLQEVCDYAFTVPSFSIHRIQETHVALFHILWDLVHVAMGAEDVI